MTEPRKLGKIYAERPIVKVATKNSDTSLWLYGLDNLFPNNLIIDVQNSATAFNAMDWLTQFLQGDGFIEGGNFVNPAKKLLNDEQTADEVLADISAQLAYFQAFTLKVIWNAQTGLVQYIRVMPFEKVRKRKDGTLLYNPRYGVDGEDEVKTKGDKDDTIYPPFSFAPPFEKIIEIREREAALNAMKKDERAKYVEPFIELLYVMPAKPAQYVYPVPSWTGGIDDVKAEFELSKFKLATIQNGFHLNKIFVVSNDDANGGVDINGRAMPNNLDEFLQDVNANKGSGNAGKSMIYSSNNPDAIKVIELQAMPDIANVVALVDDTTKRIIRSLGIPPVLLGIDTAGAMGNNQQIKNHFDLFQLRLNPTQRIVERVFKMLFPEFSWFIKPLTTQFLLPESTPVK